MKGGKMIRLWRNFLDGMGRALLISDDRDYVIPKKGGFKRDAENLRGEWVRVGNDMRRALRKEARRT
jgi:hypothetical protein